MRTKVLLCAVALAASLASSMAQNVYSLNVVGYYNVTVPAGQFTLIANQLNTTNNQIQYLLPSVTSGATLYKYASGGFASTVFSVGRSGPPGSWDSADPGGPVLNVGQGFAYVKAATAVTNQWVVSFTVQ